MNVTRFQRPTAVLLVAAFAALAGCGMADDAAAKGDTWPPTDAGPPDAAPSLTLSVEGSAMPAVGEDVTLLAILNNSPYQASAHDWKVADPMGAAVAFTPNTAGDRITFTPQVPGTHTIDCTVTLEGTGETLSSSASIQVQDSSDKLTYTARVIPSPVSGLPPKDFVKAVGSTSETGLSWQLDGGKEVLLQVTDAGGQALPAVVRLIQNVGDPIPREVYLASGSGKVRVAGTFHALFFPSSAAVPPDLVANQGAGSLPGTWTVQLDQGVEVTGSVKRSDGQLLAGATVTIYTDSSGVAVPSTIATTDSSGAFSVRSRTGVASVTVVPPSGSALPVAVVADPGLTVAGDTQGWSFAFAQAQPVQVSGVVTQSNGKAPAVGAQVVLATTIQSTVGTLTTSKGPVTATGLFRRVLSTDAAGELVDAMTGAKQFTLPQGTYQVEVWPGLTEGAEEGYFVSTHSLTSASAQLALKLASRVVLTGTVVDPDDQPLTAQVVASADTGSFSTVADDSGQFSLYLNDQTSYSLVIRSTSKKVGTYIEPQLKMNGSKDLPAIKLPKAVILAGTVTTEGNLSISGALVRIWCSGADCPSHEIVDQTTVLPDGFFELRVPLMEQNP